MTTWDLLFTQMEFVCGYRNGPCSSGNGGSSSSEEHPESKSRLSRRAGMNIHERADTNFIVQESGNLGRKIRTSCCGTVENTTGVLEMQAECKVVHSWGKINKDG